MPGCGADVGAEEFYMVVFHIFTHGLHVGP